MWTVIIFIIVIVIVIATVAALIISACQDDYDEKIVISKDCHFATCKRCNNIISWTEEDILVKHNNSILIPCPKCKCIIKAFYEK